MKNQRNQYVNFLKIAGVLFLFGLSKVGLCSESNVFPESRVHMGINVNLKNTAESDTTVVGSQIVLENETSGDFNALGENIAILSPVQGDFEVIGNRVTINSLIEGDAQIFASKVYFMQNASVEGQSKIIAQKVFLKGALLGDTYIKARKVYINGIMQGAVLLDAHKIVIGNQAIIKQGFSCPKGALLTLSKEAQIIGGITYFNPTQAEAIAHNDQIFEAGVWAKTFHFFEEIITKEVQKYWDFSSTLWSLALFLFVWLVAIGCIFLFYQATPLFLQDLTQMALENPGRSLGIGLVGLVLIPFFGILMCLTFVGIPFAFLIFLFYFALLFLGKIIGIWIFAQWLVLYTPLKKKISLGRDVLMFTLSLGIISILSLIPVLGWLFMTLVFLMGVGSILAVIFFRERKSVLLLEKL
ncbi:MAG: hypothetical protein JSS34_03715 [Proteobacteria bacterium]|nr:hypothetical protein [Pseudomonadota bacterium]